MQSVPAVRICSVVWLGNRSIAFSGASNSTNMFALDSPCDFGILRPAMLVRTCSSRLAAGIRSDLSLLNPSINRGTHLWKTLQR
jgi:hypothetical protein